MTDDIECRLCLLTCNGFVCLYDDRGLCNEELYEITVKFFDPTFLTVIANGLQTVICMKCWRHISEFHDFQKATILAQLKLLKSCTKEEVLTRVSPPCSSKDMNINIVKSENQLKIKDEFITLPELSILDMPSKSNNMSNEHDAKTTTTLDNLTAEISPNVKEEPSSDESDIWQQVERFEQAQTSKSGMDSSDSESSATDSNANELTEGTLRKKRSYRKHTRKITPNKEADDIISQWTNKLYCPLCNEYFGNFVLLTEHFKIQHPKEKRHIVCCNRRFGTRFHFAEHVRLHLNPESYKCKVCGIICGDKYYFKVHMRRHTNVANEEGATIAKVKKRTPKESDDVNSLPTVSPSTSAATKTKQRTPKEFDDIIAQWKSSLECGICQESIRDFQQLSQHFRAKHEKKKPYIVCCHKKLDTRLQIADHALIHADPNAFKCQECAKCHTSSTHLYRHMYYVHTIKRDFKCNTCEKTFQTPQRLAEHLTSHTGKHFYKCLVCPETFRYYSSLNQHLKKSHPQIWAERANIPNFINMMKIGDADATEAGYEPNSEMPEINVSVKLEDIESEQV